MHDSPGKHHPGDGFTLVELVVAASVTTILSIAIVAAIVTWLQQYSISSLRNHLTTSAQTAVQRIGDDIRRSNGLLAENQTSDPNALTPPGKWITNNSRVVLAQTPRDKDGNGLFDPPAGSYTGVPDSIVYYLKEGAIYRRIVPANYTGNINLPLRTCVGTGGCPTDIKIVDNAQAVTYTFYDKSGNVTTDRSKTTAIKIELQLASQQAGQTITVTRNLTIAFRTIGNTTTYSNAPFIAGPGGLELRNGSQIRSDDAKRDIYVRGGIQFNITDAIGTSSRPLKNVFVGNQSCGTTYTQVCSTEPITLGNGSIYADSICATGQNTTTTAFGRLQTLSSGCTAPLLNLPPFDKQAFATSITNTAGSITCNTAPTDCSVNVPANTRYSGSIGGGNARLNLTLNGNIYVEGNFGNLATGGSSLNTNITVAEGVTSRPIVLVNGKIGLEWTSINKNSNGISPIFISFFSSDPACSQNDSCPRTPTLVYNSLQQVGDAIEINGPGTSNASFYAFFDTLRVSDQAVINGTIAGQSIKLDNGLNRINLTDDIWPS